MTILYQKQIDLSNIINFDDYSTYPKEFIDWFRCHQEKTITLFKEYSNMNEYNVESFVCDNSYKLGLDDFILEYTNTNQNKEFIAYHAARIDNISTYIQDGILVMEDQRSTD